MKSKSFLMLIGASGLTNFSVVNAQEVEFAKKLANPVAALVSVPFQFNYDSSYGSAEGTRSALNIQPVIPFSINNDWNVISRTIMPVISQHDIVGKSGNQFGISDITQSLFFSPKQPTSDGLIWGAGPVLLIPSATDSLLGAEKWGAGPSGVLLTQKGSFTYGALTNHVWSFAGHHNRQNINATFLQPFFSYTTSEAWTFGVDAESSYDWNDEKWNVPANFTISKVVKLGSLPVSFQAGTRYWVTAPDSGPSGFGFRAGITFLFPH